MSNKEYIDGFFTDMNAVIDTISREDISRAVELLFEVWKAGKTVYIMGNGGSASTASHFVCDLAKCTIVDGKARFRVWGLTDNIPLVSALTNDEGFDAIFIEQLRPFIAEGDVVIALSVHGGSGADKAGLWSQNLLKAAVFAQEKGAKVLGFSGFDGGALKTMADVCIVVPADSTPQVESMHIALEHLISNCLREKIEKDY